jgi:DNA-binding NarL/FixJ family response regulator
LLVDDHPVVRDGISAHLNKVPGIVVLGGASTGAEALERATRLKPDVIVLDIKLPDTNGVALSSKLREAAPASKILAFSMHKGGDYAAALARNGVRGFLLKDDDPDDLVHAIEAVYRGELAFRGDAADAVLRSERKTEKGKLSPRELEVLRLIADGKSSKEIAWTLSIGVRTVETHRQHLMRKLNRRTVAELVKYAIQSGLTTLK